MCTGLKLSNFTWEINRRMTKFSCLDIQRFFFKIGGKGGWVRSHFFGLVDSNLLNLFRIFRLRLIVMSSFFFLLPFQPLLILRIDLITARLSLLLFASVFLLFFFNLFGSLFNLDNFDFKIFFLSFTSLHIQPLKPFLLFRNLRHCYLPFLLDFTDSFFLLSVSQARRNGGKDHNNSFCNMSSGAM